jgi:phosphonate transport system substrate-binding protein
MTELREIWRSPVIPEGPIVLSKKLPEDVKIKMTALMASLNSLDPECAYGVAAGETKGFHADHSRSLRQHR